MTPRPSIPAAEMQAVLDHATVGRNMQPIPDARVRELVAPLERHILENWARGDAVVARLLLQYLASHVQGNGQAKAAITVQLRSRDIEPPPLTFN